MKSLFKAALLLFVLVILTFVPITFAQSGNAPSTGDTAPFIKFNRLTTEDGLSNNIVTGITQDDKGFMWLATFDGLTATTVTTLRFTGTIRRILKA